MRRVQKRSASGRERTYREGLCRLKRSKQCQTYSRSNITNSDPSWHLHLPPPRSFSGSPFHQSQQYSPPTYVHTPSALPPVLIPICNDSPASCLSHLLSSANSHSQACDGSRISPLTLPIPYPMQSSTHHTINATHARWMCAPACCNSSSCDYSTSSR
jgi:hypothetical protein